MHYNIALLVCFLSGTWSASVTDRLAGEGRIVGGEDTTIERHPYQVSLQRSGGGHFCGGSIISPTIVITAAHCVNWVTPAGIRVRLGSTHYTRDGVVAQVASVVYNKNYNRSTMANDIALVKLKQSVPESNNIRYIQLAESTPPTGTSAYITGWGTKCYRCWSLPTTLQEAIVNVIDRQDCASNQYKYGNDIKEGMVCAYAPQKDSCQGDSGGPLVVEDRLVGLVSWGNGCATENYPGVYTDVASQRDWIQRTIATLN